MNGNTLSRKLNEYARRLASGLKLSGLIHKEKRKGVRTNLFPLSSMFDEGCVVELTEAAQKAFDAGKLRISIFTNDRKEKIKGLVGSIGANQGNIVISVGSDNARIAIGKASGNYDIRLWRNATVEIGDYTTCNGARIVCDDSCVRIGDDCLFSDEIIIQSADQHGIVDLATRTITNAYQKSVQVGNHVWLGRRSSLLYGAFIGDGSIVGFGSIVNRKFEANSLIVGIPGKVVKSNITWSRSPTSLDDYSRNAEIASS